MLATLVSPVIGWAKEKVGSTKYSPPPHLHPARFEPLPIELTGTQCRGERPLPRLLPATASNVS